VLYLLAYFSITWSKLNWPILIRAVEYVPDGIQISAWKPKSPCTFLRPQTYSSNAEWPAGCTLNIVSGRLQAGGSNFAGSQCSFEQSMQRTQSIKTWKHVYDGRNSSQVDTGVAVAYFRERAWRSALLLPRVYMSCWTQDPGGLHLIDYH
jgi:hypothetical protein